MKIFLFVIALVIILLPNINTAQSLKSPEEFLGYKVGTDYKIADYETIQKYFKHLAENSKMIVYEEIGKTVQDRNMFMAILSSEDNIKNLDKLQNIVKQLSDPRKITDDQAKQLFH